MNTQHVLSLALSSALGLGLIGASAEAQAQSKEKCYGVAKAGQNDCANLSGTHSCAGQAKTDMDPAEWKDVPAGCCMGMKGLTADEAKAKLKKA